MRRTNYQVPGSSGPTTGERSLAASIRGFEPMKRKYALTAPVLLSMGLLWVATRWTAVAASTSSGKSAAVLASSENTATGLACTYKQGTTTFTRNTKKAACPATWTPKASAGSAAAAVQSTANPLSATGAASKLQNSVAQPDNSNLRVTSLKIVKAASQQSLTDADTLAALGLATHRTITSNEIATSASLTPKNAYKAGFAALDVAGPSSVYYGPAGDLFFGDPHITLSPGASLQLSVSVRANKTYLFNLSFSPTQARVAKTGTFTVQGAGKAAQSVPDQTDSVSIPALTHSGSPPAHLAFVVTTSGAGHIWLAIESPDATWDFNQCDISSVAQK
jgi:hypothetical protein